MRRHRLGRIAAVLMLLLAAGPAAAEEIVWLTDVKAALEKAAKDKKVLMICINARDTPGEPMEPAALGLREVVYKDPKIVAKSKSFVCCFLTPEGSSDDYGEMRLQFGIDGNIVSPQHIFAAPDHQPGDKPLARREYWPFGKGEAAVERLLKMMDQALAAWRVKAGMPEAPAPESDAENEDGPAPAEGATDEARNAWIQKMLEMVRTGEHAVRLEALKAMVEHDRKGDCLTPLVPLVGEFDKAGNALGVGDLVRTFGIPGFMEGAEAIHSVLGHKDERVRGNAAVSLEYIGSPASVEPLMARVKKEKDARIANHMYRALGRCGAADAKVKKRLLSKASPKKKDFPCYGPAIGLGYFQGDAKLARSVEKQITRLGDIFMGGQYAKHALLRNILVWVLTEIRDPKSEKFIRKKLIAKIDDEKAWAKGQLMAFFEAAARKCAGQDDTQEAIDKGVRDLLWQAASGDRNGWGLLDGYRRGRPVEKFAPKGEFGRKPDEEQGN